MARREIKTGETLSGIAQELGITTQQLLNINPQIGDPDVIQAGSFLTIPEAPQVPPAQAGLVAEAPEGIPQVQPVPVVTSQQARQTTAERQAQLREIEEQLRLARERAQGIQAGITTLTGQPQIREGEIRTTPQGRLEIRDPFGNFIEVTNREQLRGLTLTPEQERLVEAQITAPPTVPPTVPPTEPPVEPTPQQQFQTNLNQSVQDAQTAIDDEVDAFKGLLETRASQLDASNQALVDSIKATFERRRTETRKVNEAILGAQTILGIRAGRQRFAPEIQTSILSAEERAGIQRIADLDAQELNLITAAKIANEEKQFELLNEQMELISEARKEKNQVLIDLTRQAIEQERVQRERAKETRDQLKFEREGIVFEREEAQVRAETITPLISTLFTTDAEENIDTLREFAERNNIPFEVLFNEVREFQLAEEDRLRAVQKEDLEFMKLKTGIELDELRGQKVLTEIEKLHIDNQKALGTISGGLRDKVLALSAGQQEAAFSSIATIRNAKDILDLLDRGLKTGPLRAKIVKGLGIPLPFTEAEIPIIPGKQALGISTEDEDRFIALTTAFSANFIKSISGVAVSEQEFQRLMNALPDISRQEDVIRNTVKTLVSTIRNKYELQLGVNFNDFPEDIPKLEDEFGDLENQFNKFITP